MNAWKTTLVAGATALGIGLSPALSAPEIPMPSLIYF